jgi:hypothetical protein
VLAADLMAADPPPGVLARATEQLTATRQAL